MIYNFTKNNPVDLDIPDQNDQTTENYYKSDFWLQSTVKLLYFISILLYLLIHGKPYSKLIHNMCHSSNKYTFRYFDTLLHLYAATIIYYIISASIYIPFYIYYYR